MQNQRCPRCGSLVMRKKPATTDRDVDIAVCEPSPMLGADELHRWADQHNIQLEYSFRAVHAWR